MHRVSVLPGLHYILAGEIHFRHESLDQSDKYVGRKVRKNGHLRHEVAVQNQGKPDSERGGQVLEKPVILVAHVGVHVFVVIQDDLLKEPGHLAVPEVIRHLV